MKKKFLFMLPCAAAVAIVTFIGTKSLQANAGERNDLLLANVEALCDPEGGNGEFPKYKNVTDKTSIQQTKVELGVDSTGAEIKINYSRDCVVWHTHCKHTGKDGDICYERLNGTTVVCDGWIEVK